MALQFRKRKNKRGMTMAEMLIAVAIVAILAGGSFVGVTYYLRSMAQLERDGIAKEIYVAAQNNLTAAWGAGYLGKDDYGTEDSGSGQEVYYYVVNSGAVAGSGHDAFTMMLPFASIDETVRTGGSYLVRYQKSTGTVLDVFYCSVSDSRYNHTLSASEYSSLVALSGQDKKAARRTYRAGGNSVVGWYGGETAEMLAQVSLVSPEIEVVNGEKLYVNLTDPNRDAHSLRLIVTGVTSKVSHYLDVEDPSAPVMLDDITEKNGHFFAGTFHDMALTDTGNGLIPGEDIVLKAVAFNNSALCNIAYSGEKTTNSLFEGIRDTDGDGVPDIAMIRNFRHLENLDATVSMLGSGAQDAGAGLALTAALQTDDLSWPAFMEAVGSGAGIYDKNDLATQEGCYYPISPDYAILYDGAWHSITGVTIRHEGDAGLFGATVAGSSIQNLELIDFSVEGTSHAGTLAGVLAGSEVTNVLARNSARPDDLTAADVEASAGNAGGLAGQMSGGTMELCAAALCVSGSGTAGGLIGTVSEGSIIACYAGGRTDLGEYYTHAADGSRGDALYNVTSAGTAGGLIGSAGSAAVSNSYSTCSVSGATAGGFAGTASGTITGCYCTGLVSPEEDNVFLGGGASLSGDNWYYEIINEAVTTDESGTVSGIRCREPGAEGATPIDKDADTYEAFTGDAETWANASAYDPQLVTFYGGKYSLETVYRLAGSQYNGTEEDFYASVHYGDWPSPEISLINRQ